MTAALNVRRVGAACAVALVACVLILAIGLAVDDSPAHAWGLETFCNDVNLGKGETCHGNVVEPPWQVSYLWSEITSEVVGTQCITMQQYEGGTKFSNIYPWHCADERQLAETVTPVSGSPAIYNDASFKYHATLVGGGPEP
ncbi:MAG: hypothetical protein WB698_05510 [Solirubrobacteraceae bacterium]